MSTTRLSRSSIKSPGKSLSASGSVPLPGAIVTATTGSPVVTTYNNQTLYIFKGDGSITFPGDCVVDLFIVGGGGGGAINMGGGGGAGAVREFIQVPFKAGTYVVNVGAGGNKGFSPGGGGHINAKNGEYSGVGNYESLGGGGGGSQNGTPNGITINGVDGGCGGGGSANNTNINEAGSGGIGRFGFNGGVGEYLGGGGGGGMGQVGGAGDSTGNLSNGGNGVTTTWISTTIATTNSIGEVSGGAVYFGGGGGGYSYAYVRQSTGGLGGGGDCKGSGYTGTLADAGTPNTGGGGGGGGTLPNDGGSGLIIVRV